MAPGSGRELNCSCKRCGRSFNRKSDLSRHYRIHTGERPYQCSVKDCNKSFIQRSALTVHTRTHTGEKPFACDKAGCRKAFSDSSSLARHRRIHSSKKPYICQEATCKRSCRRKTALIKDQQCSHPPGPVTQTSLEGENPAQSRPTPVNTSLMNDQYPVALQAYYPIPNLLTARFLAQEQPLVLASSAEIQLARQQYLQITQQQPSQLHLKQSRTEFSPMGYQPLSVVPEIGGHSLTASYSLCFQYNVIHIQTLL